MHEHCAAILRYWSFLSGRLGDASFFRRRILIADDEPVVAEVTATLLRRGVGCQVATVHDGEAVLHYLETESVDVLLTDMIMPGLHGLELVAAVQHQWPYIDIVVMSGHSEDFPYVNVVNAGAKDFIAKPFQHAELDAKMIRLFRERDVRDAQIVAEIKYRNLFELNTNGMVFLEKGNFDITDVNAAFCELVRTPREKLIQKSLVDLLEATEQDRFQQGLKLCARSGQGTIGDVGMACLDGEKVYVDITATFISVASEHIVCLAFKDITEKREFEEGLVEAAQVDNLTGLLNKRAFNTNLEGFIVRARRDSAPLSLLFMDLDNFKRCNDTQGHQVGDDVLRTIGRLVHKNIRGGLDEGFRFGGDEFAVILPGVTAATAVVIAERLRCDLENAENFGTSLSIGVAEYKNGMPAAALARAADKALYRAKALGKNRVFQAVDYPVTV